MRVNLKAKRMLSKLLCLAMVLGLVPTLALPALAAEEQAGTGNETYSFQLSVSEVSDGFTLSQDKKTVTIQTGKEAVTGTVKLNLTYTIGDSIEEPVKDGAYKLTKDSFVFAVPGSPDIASPVTGVGEPDENGTITVTLSVPTASTDVSFTVTANIYKGNDKVKENVPVGTIEVKAYYPTPINLTGIENAVGTVTDGKFTVNSEKACVVLYAETEETVTKDNAANSTAIWKRLEAQKSGESYTFDLTDKNAKTVVVALKGDVTFDGEVTGSDISGLVGVAALSSQKYPSGVLQGIANVARSSDSIEKVTGSDISALVQIAALSNKWFTSWD